MTTSAETPEDRSPRRRMNYGEGREALLNAAVRVVARGGLRKLTYRAVAEEAGTTHGLVVHHFGSRDALVEEALAHSIRTSLNISALEPGTGNTADFAAGVSDMVTGNPDLEAFQYELLLEGPGAAPSCCRTCGRCTTSTSTPPVASSPGYSPEAPAVR